MILICHAITLGAAADTGAGVDRSPAACKRPWPRSAAPSLGS